MVEVRHLLLLQCRGDVNVVPILWLLLLLPPAQSRGRGGGRQVGHGEGNHATSRSTPSATVDPNSFPNLLFRHVTPIIIPGRRRRRFFLLPGATREAAGHRMDVVAESECEKSGLAVIRRGSEGGRKSFPERQKTNERARDERTADKRAAVFTHYRQSGPSILS